MIPNHFVSPLEVVPFNLGESYRIHFCGRIPLRVSATSFCTSAVVTFNTSLKLLHHARCSLIYIGTHTLSMEVSNKNFDILDLQNFRICLHNFFDVPRMTRKIPKLVKQPMKTNMMA